MAFNLHAAHIAKLRSIILRERYIEDVEVDGCTVRLDPLAHCKFVTVYVECESC